MNHPASRPWRRTRRRWGERKKARANKKASSSQGGFFLFAYRGVFVPLSRKSARYRPRTLLLLQPLDCGLSFKARLRISYHTILNRAFRCWYWTHSKSPDRISWDSPDKSAPPLLILLAVVLCVKGIPLAPVPDTCTARSTCARASSRRSAIITSIEAALAILGGPFTSRPVVLHQPSGSIVTVFVFRLASWRVGSPDCRSASYAPLRPGTTFGTARLFPPSQIRPNQD
jgi:hypothetical protein